MSASGFNWGAYAYLGYSSGTDINAIAVADAGSLTSDEIDLDGYAAAEVGWSLTEDDTGPTDGDVYFYVCGEGAAGYETIDDDPMQAASFAMDQNATRHGCFTLDPAQLKTCKVLCCNDCGQEVALTLKIRYATFDAA